ncbi:hypothetical protein GGI15_002676 [Coemansia interrupta]|uniref:Enhancer of mRNA-decapping protein 4 WD40 repeat region domain-containing protein n=1 Tax=Coemansia interrupta TaxID=1126814 RepID=A0A9W8HJC1_9FUNG|nr:hypothetical protein GGI15_002676 [Coemansia interrupta]
MRRGSNYASPLLSTNTASQPAAGAASQVPANDLSFSLLQTLLKPQAPAAAPATHAAPPTAATAQTYSSTQSPMQVSDLERAFGVPEQPKSTTNNPIDQLRRMMAAQSNASGASGNGSGTASASASVSGSDMVIGNGTAFPTQTPSTIPAGTSAARADVAPNTSTKPQASSTYTSPRLRATSAASIPSGRNRSTAGTPIPGGNDTNSSPAGSAGGTPRKQPKVSNMIIDPAKIKLEDKPEIVPISLLQQSTRFYPGRLISVSRDYICYAVRSKEGGRIRVIHQLHGQLAKMQGHTESIIDMAFHPCSREPGMPQILASLGKDNRLIVWLISPVDVNAASSEDAIAYEPFINVDSSGDARFTCLAWRTEIIDGTMELCVGTDRGFMIIRAPIPSSQGQRSDLPNGGLVIVPVPTESGVTAIERIGLDWVIVGTEDRLVRIYELSKQWAATSGGSEPCKVVSDITKCEQPADTLIYITPTCKEDGAGHVVFGYSMNKKMQLWWLGNGANQIMRLQRVSFAGSAPKLTYAFAAISWAEQGRCLTAAATHAPAALFVLRSTGTGENMRLERPVGYSLGEDQPALSFVSVVEPPVTGDTSGPCLSIYSVHNRLVQQLQIAGFDTVERQSVPDPAVVFSQGLSFSEQAPAPALAPAAPKTEAAPTVSADNAAQAAGYQRLPSQQPASIPATAPPTAPSTANIQAELSAQIKSQVAVAMADLQANNESRLNNVSLSSEAESKLVERISAQVENRVIQGMAAVMEQTLIPAYNRATATMFEQMQSTFEAGLREWWMRFAQMMPPPPPPHIATPLSHIPMMPQPQPQAMVGDIQQQQQQQANFASQPNAVQQQMAMSVSMQPPPAGSGVAGAPGPNHLEAIMGLLKIQPNQQARDQPQLMDSAITAHGQRTASSENTQKLYNM